MDFIAEMVLGFADLELSKLIKLENIEDYSILRYRDDYRIFVNNPQDGEKIIKSITEIMSDLGLKINKEKTKMKGLSHPSYQADFAVPALLASGYCDCQCSSCS